MTRARWSYLQSVPCNLYPAICTLQSVPCNLRVLFIESVLGIGRGLILLGIRRRKHQESA